MDIFIHCKYDKCTVYSIMYTIQYYTLYSTHEDHKKYKAIIDTLRFNALLFSILIFGSGFCHSKSNPDPQGTATRGLCFQTE